MYSFNELKRFAQKRDAIDSKKIKIALLADSATQLLNTAIAGTGCAANINYEIWEADYNQIDRQVFDPNSELYSFAPDYVIILISSEHLIHEFYKIDAPQREGFAQTKAEYLRGLFEQVSSKIKCKIISNTFFEINDSIFGNYSTKIASSFMFQMRKLNLLLMELARHRKDLFLLDIAALTSHAGYANAFDAKLYFNSSMVYNLDIIPVIAYNIHSIIQSINGYFKKCLILDLDNTLWGGIIGDDGVQGISIGDLGIGKAFTELQLWIKELKKRGIILAVCSKNTEAIAKEPFEQHPEMELRLDDIAVFVANWENKVDNIRYIQNVLQIGFDSMVFLDDNPFEREMVKTAIPELTVPFLPEDPAEYLIYLRQLNLFETASFTEEDESRTKQYQEEAKRSIVQKSFANENEFLQSLQMNAEVKPFDSFTIPRIAQLSQRSNQFNLRTIRYNEEEVKEITAADSYYTLSFTLDDIYGSYGLIAYIILKRRDKNTLFIDSWVMSCRVLKRGMEIFTLSNIIEIAEQGKCQKIIGEYIPTKKNGLVKDHYEKLGFHQVSDTLWELDLDNLPATTVTFIKKNSVLYES